jgi:hypothetical protein
MDKSIIKIQRLFRIKNINNKFALFEDYNIYNNFDMTFDDYTTIIRNKKVLMIIKIILNNISKLCNIELNIIPQIILTGFLIKNYPDEILGIYKDRHPIDNVLFDWSKTLVKIFKKKEKFNDFKLLANYLNNYKDIFNNWKFIDKNRTIQNIIVSYYNRRKHLESINIEKMNNDVKKNVINVLETENIKLLSSIKLIDKDFDIENLIINYENIYNEIKKNMSKIFTTINGSFKKAYYDYLYEEFKNNNNQVIYDLILETNKRIILLAPDKYKSSIRTKFNSYNYNDMLLSKNNKGFYYYLKFLFDSIINLSAEEDDDVNINTFNNNLNKLQDINNYYIIVPHCLIDANIKIDKIFNLISNLV